MPFLISADSHHSCRLHGTLPVCCIPKPNSRDTAKAACHAVVSRPYPWGSELLASLKVNSPPAVDISMQLLEPVRGGQAYSCQITVARQGPAVAAEAEAAQQLGVQGAWAANSAPAAGDSLPSTLTPCKLLVGCSSTDELLLLRQVVLERMDSPTKVCPATSHTTAGRQHAPLHGGFERLVLQSIPWT